MKVGVILPTFRDDPADALAVAAAAEAEGVDGVFAYDHLWPMGQPARPALAPFPVLAAVAQATERLVVGTLVARVGLVAEEVLLAEFASLRLLAPGRVVAALGTGDHLSAAENLAYGVPYQPPDVRRDELARLAAELLRRGFPVWVGGGSAGTVARAEAVGAAVNLWDVPPDAVAAQAQRSEVTWAGPSPGVEDDGAARERLSAQVPALARAGATWAVFGWPVSLPTLAAAAEATRAA